MDQKDGSPRGRDYAPESKHRSMEWKHPGSPVKKKFKSQLSARKVMLTIFWDSQGVILEHYLERGTTVNSVGYSEMLSTEAYCLQVFCCCMTTCAHILPSTLFKLLWNWVSRCWNILNTVPISPPRTTIFLVHLTLILQRSRTGTVWFYTSTSNKRAARPKLYTKLLTRDLKLMYSRLTLVRITINL